MNVQVLDDLTLQMLQIHLAKHFSLGGLNGDGTKGDTKLRNFWCIFDVLNFLCGEPCSQMVTH